MDHSPASRPAAVAAAALVLLAVILLASYFRRSANATHTLRQPQLAVQSPPPPPTPRPQTPATPAPESVYTRAGRLKEAPLARRLVVCPALKLMFCPVPKVASSNWKVVIARLCLGDKEAAKYSPEALHDKAHTPLTVMADVSVDLVAKAISSPEWLRFVFVRDPATRSVSGYLNKLRDGYQLAYVTKKRSIDEYAAYIASVFSWKYTREHDLEKEGAPPYVDFVQALWNLTVNGSGTLPLNEHWAPQSDLCDVSNFPYNFIGHFENYSNDSTELLNKLGRPDVTFPDQKAVGFPGTGASDLTPEMVTGETRQLLREIYAQDYELLGYE